MCSILKKLKFREDKVTEDKTTFMIRNGAIVLKELITSSYGKYNPYRIFSAKELELATNNYNQINLRYRHASYVLYEGFWQDRLVSVLKYCRYYGKSINNIVYASQMSHNHILKVIGCCLETEIPIVIFEYFLPQNLADRIFDSPQPQFERLSLKYRLKIAMDIANAVGYINVGFPRPIIIGDFETSRIVFNEENVAKLFDLSTCISIPEGETHVTDSIIWGTYPYLAPEYAIEGVALEKTDVYSFGIFLLELLTGQKSSGLLYRDNVDYSMSDSMSKSDYLKKYLEEKRLDEIVDRSIVEDRLCPQKEQQLQAFRQLILECVKESAEDRPTMVDVAKKLRQMYRSCV